MKTGPAAAAVALILAASALGLAQDTLESKMGATATFDAGTKKLTLVLKGKESGIYVNTEYPLKCTLKIEDGGTLEKAEVRVADAKLEDAGKPGKAKSATFILGADKHVSGECKMVACSESGCSSPFKLPFSSK
jgi:hypothetical protein